MSGNVAILSDIHGNAHALRAVLADMESQGITERVCLGDVVGYGAFPGECIELVREGGFECIQGNHDAMISYGGHTLDEMNPLAREAIVWTQGQLTADEKLWLTNLPLTLKGSDYEGVHASLHHPWEWNYVLESAAAAQSFSHQTKPLCFIGHSHRPALWVEGEARAREITTIEDLRSERKQLINVGSVGQPRDRESKACYAVYRRQQKDVWWRRVPYEVPAAQKAILEAGLPSVFALRLELGK